MATVGIHTCPHCGKPPVPGTTAKGNTIFVCCSQGGERTFDDLQQLPIKPLAPSDANVMPVLRP